MPVELKKLVMMIEVEVLKNMDKPQYHHRAIEIMLEAEEFEMAEDYCANYEGRQEDEDVEDGIGNENYFGM